MDGMEPSLGELADCFCHGFCYTRSFTHPYEFVRVGPLRVMRDRPRTTGDDRNSEIIAVGADPDEVCATLRGLKPKRFYLCALDSVGADFEAVKAAYKRRHFRMLRKEPMFVCDCTSLPRGCETGSVIRVIDIETADKVRAAAGRPQIQSHDLHDGDATLRLYAAMVDSQPVGWVKSIRTGPSYAWVSNLHVLQSHRRRGIGEALMRKMLEEDQRYGVQWSVLLASSDGAKLYPRVGYREVGILQMFSPIKEAWGLARYR